MSLQDLAEYFEKIGGVKQTRILSQNSEPILQVFWKGNPYDYSIQVNNIRNDFPQVTQVEAPKGKPKKDPDSMPIAYYSF